MHVMSVTGVDYNGGLVQLRCVCPTQVIRALSTPHFLPGLAIHMCGQNTWRMGRNCCSVDRVHREWAETVTVWIEYTGNVQKLALRCTE